MHDYRTHAFRRFWTMQGLQSRAIIAMNNALKAEKFSIYEMDQEILDDLIDFHPNFAHSIQKCRRTADAIAEVIEKLGGEPDVPTKKQTIRSIFSSETKNIATRPLSDLEAKYSDLRILQKKQALMLALHITAEYIYQASEVNVPVPEAHKHAELFLGGITKGVLGSAPHLFFEMKTGFIRNALLRDEDMLLFLQDDHIPPERYDEIPPLFERHTKMVEVNLKKAFGITLANSPPVLIKDLGGPTIYGRAYSKNTSLLTEIYKREEARRLEENPYSIGISPAALEKGPSFAYLAHAHELTHVMDFEIMHKLARHELDIEPRDSHNDGFSGYLKFTANYYEDQRELLFLQGTYRSFLPYNLFPAERMVWDQHAHIEKFVKDAADDYREKVLRCPVNTTVNRVTLAAISALSAPLPRI